MQPDKTVQRTIVNVRRVNRVPQYRTIRNNTRLYFTVGAQSPLTILMKRDRPPLAAEIPPFTIRIKDIRDFTSNIPVIHGQLLEFRLVLY
jgi:hypothetical protein